MVAPPGPATETGHLASEWHRVAGRSSDRTVRYDSESEGRASGMTAGDSREQQEG